jgi:hypothetical protein
MGRQRHDVRDAASILGISPEAVRKRAHRGTLPSEKDEDGHLYVYLDEVQDTGQDGGMAPTQAHLDSLQEQVDFLRRELSTRDEELAEMRRIVAGLVQRIPAIEAPTEARESPETASEEEGKGSTRKRSGGPGGSAGLAHSPGPQPLGSGA